MAWCVLPCGYPLMNWWFAINWTVIMGMCRDMLAGEFQSGLQHCRGYSACCRTLFRIRRRVTLSEAAGLGYDEGPLAWFFLAGVLLSVDGGCWV